VATRCGAAQVLDHAEAGQDDPEGQRQRDQQPGDGAGQVDPAVADPVGLAADQAADQRDRGGEAHRRAEEGLGPQAGGLGQAAESRLSRVVLPAGVGREADGRVEGERRAHAGVAERVRQGSLESQQQVQQQDARQGHREQRPQVLGPPLVGLRVDAATSVHDGLGPPVPPGAERPRHVVAERHVQRHDEY
jgi:hypothetical protein